MTTALSISSNKFMMEIVVSLLTVLATYHDQGCPG